MLELDNYLEARAAVYDYFGYVEDWPAIPLRDRREYFWHLNGEDSVFYARSEEYARAGEGDEHDGYEDQVLHHRHLPQAIYPGAEYTLIVVDPGVDGNRFLAVYDNAKRVA